MHRRDVVFAGLTLPLLGSLAREPGLTLAAEEEKPTAFDPMHVRQPARDLAQKPYKPPDTNLPPPLKDLSYDHGPQAAKPEPEPSVAGTCYRLYRAQSYTFFATCSRSPTPAS